MRRHRGLGLGPINPELHCLKQSKRDEFDHEPLPEGPPSVREGHRQARRSPGSGGSQGRSRALTGSSGGAVVGRAARGRRVPARDEGMCCWTGCVERPSPAGERRGRRRAAEYGVQDGSDAGAKLFFRSGLKVASFTPPPFSLLTLGYILYSRATFYITCVARPSLDLYLFYRGRRHVEGVQRRGRVASRFVHLGKLVSRGPPSRRGGIRSRDGRVC